MPPALALALLLAAAAPGATPRPLLADAEAQARAGHTEAAIAAVDQALSYGAAHASDILSNPVFRPLHGDSNFRRVIRINAEETSSLVDRVEPGVPLAVSGVVRDTEGKPVLGALVYAFHADAAGRYTAAGGMDEAHARLFAYLRTGSSGRYGLRTIRPGGYPEPRELDGKARLIPAHLHFEVSASSFRTRRFQLVFADDPRLDEHWRSWARHGEHPIASIERGEDGLARVTLDITLTPR